MMRILLVVSLYRPEISSAAELMRELAEELVSRGHQVTVLTSAPLHRLDETDAARSWPEFREEDGVSVVRARTLALHQVGYLQRGLGVLFGPLQMWRTLRSYVSTDFDAAFIYSPPVTLGFIGYLLKKRGAGVIFNVQDIFPQNAIDLGILRNPVLIALFRWIERFSYKHADIVTAHSKSNLDLLISANGDIARKFRTLHNWIDITNFSVSPRKNYRQLFGLDGKYVAVFAGVLGPSQNVDMLVQLADKVRDLHDFVILVVGDGTEKQRAETLARSLGLGNIVFRPFISQEDYPDLLACVDLGLVCLGTSVKTPVVPGKILGYMVASLPVAAFVNAESDVHHLMLDAKCGASCISDDLSQMEQIVRRMHGNRTESKNMGDNGRKYAVEHFSKDRITDEIERMMDEISNVSV
jgi:glycosyltransferase involved in cell wall biosynthesis